MAGEQGAIVVGIDGSDQAKTALRWALGQARRTGQRLRVVSAWHVPALMYAARFVTAADLDPLALGQVAAEALDDAIADLGDLRDVIVERCNREGRPAEVLIAESTEADLLVLGARGSGGFDGLLIGSVSSQCAQHASCPVLVVRVPEECNDRRTLR